MTLRHRHSIHVQDCPHLILLGENALLPSHPTFLLSLSKSRLGVLSLFAVVCPNALLSSIALLFVCLPYFLVRQVSCCPGVQLSKCPNVLVSYFTKVPYLSYVYCPSVPSSYCNAVVRYSPIVNFPIVLQSSCGVKVLLSFCPTTKLSDCSAVFLSNSLLLFLFFLPCPCGQTNQGVSLVRAISWLYFQWGHFITAKYSSHKNNRVKLIGPQLRLTALYVQNGHFFFFVLIQNKSCFFGFFCILECDITHVRTHNNITSIQNNLI